MSSVSLSKYLGVPLSGIFGVIGPGVEFFGGLAVLLGLQTRYAAVLIAVFTIVATAISHRYWEFSDAARRAQEVNFMKNVCIIGGFLLLAAVGGGRFSIDTLWRLLVLRRLKNSFFWLAVVPSFTSDHERRMYSWMAALIHHIA
jgi:uncharacterized membrane protein YphA (DoxX/SURF4 family)